MKIGHCRQRSPGRWELRWRDAAHKLRTTTVSAKRERDAYAQLAQFAGRSSANAPHKLTTAEWLRSWHAALDAAAVTKQNYKSVIDNWLIPELGNVRLRGVIADHRQSRFRADGRPRQKALDARP